MSATRIDVSLAKYEIGITGAIPGRENWSEPAMDYAILEFVALFTGIVFKYGGRIIHGCHPALTSGPKICLLIFARALPMLRNLSQQNKLVRGRLTRPKLEIKVLQRCATCW